MKGDDFIPHRKYLDRLIRKEDIPEEMVLITGSSTDYITSSGKVYKDYNDNMFLLKSSHINKHNGYVYVNITFDGNKNKSRRLHVLLAKAYIFNPNPKKFKIVGHRNNNKEDFSLANLYWTDTQENTQKAIDEGLSIQKSGAIANVSNYLKVIDKTTGEIVGVYGSMRECARAIDNINVSTICKLYKRKNYVPRTRKYIYQISNKNEYEQYPELQNNRLTESPANNKSPKVFRMNNKQLNYSEIFDNQVKASELCNIPQATISQCLKKGKIFNGWEFIYIETITMKESTAFQNYIDLKESIAIQNINDQKILEFKSGAELKCFLNIRGHDLKQYITNNHILMSEWRIINANQSQENVS